MVWVGIDIIQGGINFMDEKNLVVIESIKKEIPSVEATVNAIVIKTSEDYTNAAGLSKTIKGFIKQIKEQLDPDIEKANALHKSLTAKRGSYLLPLEKSLKVLGVKILEHDAEQERIRQEAQRKLDEIARKEREKQEAAAREQRQKEEDARKAQELLEQQAREATDEKEKKRLEAEAAAKQKEAEKAAQKAEIKEIKADSVVAAVAQSNAIKIKGMSIPDNWTAEITDLSALVKAVAAGTAPIIFIAADMTVLNKQAKAVKNTLSYPGVKFVNKPILRQRG